MTSTRTRPSGRPDVPGRPSVGARLAFLRSPGWLGAIAGALAFAAVCFWVLAPWQFHRHVERDIRNSEIAVAARAEPVPLDQRLTSTDGIDPGESWQQVTATGQFLADRQVVVRLRQDENTGNPASEILAPLQLADGSILLVDRGYVPIDQLTGGVAAPAAPSGELTVTGRLQPFQPDPLKRAPVRVGERLEVYGIAADSIADLPGPVLGGFIQLVDGSPGVLTPIGVPQMDPGPYFSYAWQWLAFGTMSILAIGFFVFREFTDPRDPDPQDPQDQQARQPPRTAARAAAESVGVPVPEPGSESPPAPGRSKRTRPRRGFDRGSLYDPS
jgi:cytochrome oxidase assembly protein ShyY1